MDMTDIAIRNLWQVSPSPPRQRSSPTLASIDKSPKS
jgi:hypothetical protein